MTPVQELELRLENSNLKIANLQLQAQLVPFLGQQEMEKAQAIARELETARAIEAKQGEKKD